MIADKIRQRNESGARFSLAVVAEGSMPQGGDTLYRAERDLGGAARLGGIGEMVAAQLQKAGYADVRAAVLGHLQRGASPYCF